MLAKYIAYDGRGLRHHDCELPGLEAIKGVAGSQVVDGVVFDYQTLECVLDRLHARNNVVGIVGPVIAHRDMEMQVGF